MKNCQKARNKRIRDLFFNALHGITLISLMSWHIDQDDCATHNSTLHGPKFRAAAGLIHHHWPLSQHIVYVFVFGHAKTGFLVKDFVYCQVVKGQMFSYNHKEREKPNLPVGSRFSTELNYFRKFGGAVTTTPCPYVIFYGMETAGSALSLPCCHLCLPIPSIFVVLQPVS